MTSIRRSYLRIVILATFALCFFSMASNMAYCQSSTGTQPPAPPFVQEGVPRFGHVFMIIGENTTYDHLTSTNAPYLMGTIRPQAAWFTEYYGATHWSQANYVALVTGQFTRCEQQD